MDGRLPLERFAGQDRAADTPGGDNCEVAPAESRRFDEWVERVLEGVDERFQGKDAAGCWISCHA